MMSRLLLSLLLLAACRDKEPAEDTDAGLADRDGDGYDETVDCSDINSAVHPDAAELCNELDDDCDGEIDEAGALDGTASYTDADADGYGDDASLMLVCAPVEGAVTVGGDCDDADAAESPEAVEICDGDDDDCDGEADEMGADGGTLYAEDADGDGYGHRTNTVMACAPGDGAVENTEDCDDLDEATHPGADEICNGDDDDCDGERDEDAADATSWYRDQDQDRFGTEDDEIVSCDAPDGYVAAGGDCDDENSLLNPSRAESCDGLDNDCDGEVDDGAVATYTWYTDADGDSFGDDDTETKGCTLPGGVVEVGGDCDDTDADINPDATETCDGVDEDCDGAIDDGVSFTWYTDSDGDGYGDDSTETISCTLPSGALEVGGDCDDTDEDVNPDAEEVCDDTDGKDNDCDGRTDPGCSDTDNRARWMFGFHEDPTELDCDLWWDNTWTITRSTCTECEWTADVDFAYDSSTSYQSSPGACGSDSDLDWTWALGYDADYFADYGYGAMYYYTPDYGYWFPVWLATWDESTGELYAGGGYYAYPYSYGGVDYYYTRQWRIYATVYYP